MKSNSVSPCVCRSTGGSSDIAANIIDRHISVTQMVYYGFRKRESKNKLRATNIITAPSNLDKHTHTQTAANSKSEAHRSYSRFTGAIF